MGVDNHSILDVVEDEDVLSKALFEACQVVLWLPVPWPAVSPSYADI